MLALAALVPALAACGGERPLAGDTLRLVAEGSVSDTRWAVLGDPINSRFSRSGSYGSSYELPANRGWIVFEAVPERVARVQLTVARYPRTTTTFDVYHPAGPRPVTRTLEARTIERSGLPARYWVLVTPPGFEVPSRGALTYLDANGHML